MYAKVLKWLKAEYDCNFEVLKASDIIELKDVINFIEGKIPGLHESDDGLYITSYSGVKYILYEGKTIGGKKELRSDYIIVIDDFGDELRSADIVGWQYGAMSINSSAREKIEENLLEMIANFEKDLDNENV